MKAYVVRAEDARLLGDMPMVRKLYAELHTLNRRLVGEYAKRANNHRVSHQDTQVHPQVAPGEGTWVVPTWLALMRPHNHVLKMWGGMWDCLPKIL